jgi:hypothetical protein
MFKIAARLRGLPEQHEFGDRHADAEKIEMEAAFGCGIL